MASQTVATIAIIAALFGHGLTTTVNIGIINLEGASLNTTLLQSIEDAWYNHTNVTGVDLSLRVLDLPSPLDPFTLSSWVSKWLCDPYNISAVVSIDACSRDVQSAFEASKLPVLRVSSTRRCSVDVEGEYVHTMPRLRPLEDMMQEVVIGQDWNLSNIFYENTSLEYYMSKVVNGLGRHMIQSQLHQIDDMITPEELKTLIDPGDTYPYRKTNNVILCSINNTVKILEQANIVQQNYTAKTGMLHHSRWLVLVEDDDPSALIGHFGDIDNLAVIKVTPDIEIPLAERITNGAYMLGKAVYEMLQVYGDLRWNRTQCHPWSGIQISKSLKSLLNEPGNTYDMCSGYHVYAVTWQGAQQMLSDQGYCLSDGKARAKIVFFPNEMYGFNRRKFRIATNIEKPFVQYNESSHPEGLCIDMLNEMARVLNFTYDLDFPADQQFGAYVDGKWTGLVGMLERREVDFVFAPLATSSGRAKVMDFSVPYHFAYSTVLIRAPDMNERKWRVVIEPFRWHVWMCLFFSVPIVGLTVWAVSRLTFRVLAGTIVHVTDEFGKVQPSTWYVFGALLTQGGAYLPLTAPGRLIISFWWLFSIIMVATYSGNLIAFLTFTKEDTVFGSLKDMVSQTSTKYGTLEGTVFTEELPHSNDSLFMMMWQNIVEFNKSDHVVLSSNFSEHVEKVLAGGYTFVYQETPLKIEREQNCDFILLKEKFWPFPFGIGIQKGSHYKEIIDNQVTKLLTSGIIKYWEQRYWPHESSCSPLTNVKSREVTLLDTQSAFYVLVGGIILSLLALTVEAMRERCRRRDKITPEILPAKTIPPLTYQQKGGTPDLLFDRPDSGYTSSEPATDRESLSPGTPRNVPYYIRRR